MANRFRLWWERLDNVGMIDPRTRDRFPGAAGYFNTASLGLPSDGTVAAMEDAIAAWEGGSAEPPDYDKTSRRPVSCLPTSCRRLLSG